MITYVTGDATSPIAPDLKIIVHVCNDIGGWGKGFVKALSKKWKEPESEYRRWHKEEGETPFELGQVQFVQVEDDIWVANMICQRDIRKRRGIPPVRYDAIRQGLARVFKFAAEKGASIHMPRIGCGLAGGKWEEVGKIVEEELVAKGVGVTVYDLA